MCQWKRLVGVEIGMRGVGDGFLTLAVGGNGLLLISLSLLGGFKVMVCLKGSIAGEIFILHILVKERRRDGEMGRWGDGEVDEER